MNDAPMPHNATHPRRRELPTNDRDRKFNKSIAFRGAVALMLFTVVPAVAHSTASAATASHTGSSAAVHMELKNPSNGAIACQAYDTPASSRPIAQDCPTGVWTEQLFDSGWGQIGTNTTVTVDEDDDSGEPETPGPYQRIFAENFDGSSLSGNWQTPDWPESYRNADFRRDQCVVSGGLLSVTASLNDDQVRSCYAHTNETFGPGSGQLKVQYRVNLSRVQAEGGWFAAWLNTLSGEGNPYDGNPSTGTEIDVLEYVPYQGAYQFSSNDIDTRNSFHPAVHTVDGTGGFISPETNGNGFYDAGSEGINLQSGWHTFGLVWSAECQVFSIDGQNVWTNRDGVSSAEVHRLFLTMEMSDEGSSGYNQWGFASGTFADNLRTSPAEAQVDWVTVDQKSAPDAGLCNG